MPLVVATRYVSFTAFFLHIPCLFWRNGLKEGGDTGAGGHKRSASGDSGTTCSTSGTAPSGVGGDAGTGGSRFSLDNSIEV
jgi:hypothetical protein